MTPGARIAAAAQCLDEVLAGSPAERVLTNWARASRFAGSKDRAAVRDLVFEALRRRRSLAWLGGAETGRGLMLGLLRATGADLSGLMDGQGHALPPPRSDEAGRDLAEAPESVRLDLPDWLAARMAADLGGAFPDAARTLTGRAPVTLRVNLSRLSRGDAQAALRAEGVTTDPDPEVPTALRVTDGAARVSRAAPYLDGRVELQDAASQAAVLRLPLAAGQKVLDYCAGGGGKSLAMGDRAPLRLFAHDADPRRMADLPPRAERAGLHVRLLVEPSSEAPFDLVLVDAPCSGSGTWRRTPEAKWRLNPGRLDELTRLQDQILDEAAPLVRAGGHLAFATCSVLDAEGDDRVAAFLARHPGWTRIDRYRRLPDARGDGFHQTVLRRDPGA